MPVRAFLIELIDNFITSKKSRKAQHILPSIIHDAVP